MPQKLMLSLPHHSLTLQMFKWIREVISGMSNNYKFCSMGSLAFKEHNSTWIFIKAGVQDQPSCTLPSEGTNAQFSKSLKDLYSLHI
nr:hypothetical protein CFP56_15776 [Quercus suber]